MDINSPINPSPEPRDPNMVPRPPITQRQFVSAAPTPPPLRNPLTAAPVPPQSTPVAMPEPVVQMSTPQPVVSAPAPIPAPVPSPAPVQVPAPSPVSVIPPTAQIPVVQTQTPQPAAGEVFAKLNTDYVEPPLGVSPAMRSIPPMGGAVAVAAVPHKRRWPIVLFVLILIILGAGAAYVFGYDRTVLLGSKDLLTKSLVANSEITQAAGEIEVKVSTTLQVASSPQMVGEAIYDTPSSIQMEPMTIDFAMAADFGYRTVDGSLESFVEVDPFSISITPEYLAENDGIPSKIDSAFEVRVVRDVLYAKISRLTPDFADMLEMLAGEDVVGTWYSTASYVATTTTNIEDTEDALRIGTRILNEAVTIDSDVYKFGSREITFTLSPEKFSAIMADEDGFDDEMKAQAREDLKKIEFKKPMQFFVVIDKTMRIKEFKFSTAIEEKEEEFSFDVAFSYRLTSTTVDPIEAPMGTIIDLDKMYEEQFIEANETEQVKSMFELIFSQMLESDVITTAVTYAGVCEQFAKEYPFVDGVWPNFFASELPEGYVIRDFLCFDSETSIVMSAALYKDDVKVAQYCYDPMYGIERAFMPVADPTSISCIATIR